MKKIFVLIFSITAIALLSYLQFGLNPVSMIAISVVSVAFAVWLFSPEIKRLISKEKKSTVWWDGLDDRHCYIERNGESVAIRYSDGSVKFYAGATCWDKIRIHFL
ncbi:MAG: hypothetical protein WCT50_04585 [Patescibacteria group bacterium]